MIEMKAQEVEIDPMTPEQCWAEIEAVGEIMTVPGMLQSNLREDADLGPQFVENAKQILHIIVDNFDAGISPDDQAIVDKLNAMFVQNQVLQNRYTIRQLTRASIAMQQLPLNEMILSLQGVELTDGVDEAGREELKKLETEEKSAGMAKMDPRIMRIMSLGINAAGGQVEFAKLQHATAANLPDLFKGNPETQFTAQMIGAIMTAISSRASTREFTLAAIRSTIEMVIGAKQALTLAHMTAYHMNAEQMIGILVRSAEHHINQALCDCGCNDPAPEAEAPKKPVNAAATHVAEKKPGSFNFEGNRTVN
ncbi:hypothetical protein phiK7B1_076 [Pseudomonas phage phiK7B1]|nr:hypothetical protein phiK7B1_076 [Pseudomonas phage phiK7B1]